MKKNLYFLTLVFSFLALLFSCETEDPDSSMIACFSQPDSVYAGVPAVFSAACSENADAFLWNISTGESYQTTEITHTFSTPGDFTVTLIVTDSEGATGETSKKIKVYGAKTVDLRYDINANRTLYNDSIYIVRDYIEINAVLTIEPGTIIKFDNNTAMECLAGKIVAEGTELLPIIFTSLKDDLHGGDVNNDGTSTQPDKGDWRFISIEGTTNASVFTYCEFYYAGADEYYDYTLNIETSGTTVHNCTFAYSTSGRFGALNYEDATGNNTMHSNTFFGNTIPLTINGTLDIDKTNTFSNPDNPAIKNEKNAIHVIGLYEPIQGKRTWTEDEVPFILADDTYDMEIGTGNSLTLEPGVVVKLRDRIGIFLDGGILMAEGTESNPIVFTSFADDNYGGDTNADENLTQALPGDWDHIRVIGNNNTSTFRYCHFMYGGADEYYDYTMTIESDYTTVDHCMFSHNVGAVMAALMAEEALEHTVITNNVFFDNTIPLAINGKFDVDNSNTFHNPSTPSEVNVKNGIFVTNSYDGIIGSRTWEETEVPFVIPGDYNLEIRPGNSLTLANDVILKFDTGRSLIYEDDNLFNYDGSGVWFTSLKDDVHGGDTNGDGSQTTPADADWRGVENNVTNEYELWENILYDEN